MYYNFIDIGLVERVTVAKIDIATDSFKNSTQLWEGQYSHHFYDYPL